MKDKKYIVSFKDKNVSLYGIDGKIIRKFMARAKIVNAQITKAGQNPVIAIATEDGKYEIYHVDGRIIRQS